MGLTVRSRRAILYVPGDDLRKIRKASTLQVDSVCLDMEDGVARNRKEEARNTIGQALQTIEFAALERMARINPVSSGLEMDDLRQAVRGRPQALVVPKVEQPAAIEWVAGAISELENEFGFPPGDIKILAMIESAAGVVNLDAISHSSNRLEALIFGAEDFASSIGATRTSAGSEVFFARSAVLTYASAYGLQAIDMVYVDFRDIAGLEAEARLGSQLGFTGKQVIHPDQVRPVQEAFTPDQQTIDRALQLIQSFEQQQSIGKGVFGLDGKMVEAPMIRAAHSVLARARAAGRLQN